MQEPMDQSKSPACEDTEVEGNCAEPSESTEVKCSCEEVSEDTESEDRSTEVNEECSCSATNDMCSNDCDVDADTNEGDDCPVPEASAVEETGHPGCPPSSEPYTITSGDTYTHLAQRFNTTVAAIVSANPFVDPDDLRVGQVVCVPRQPFYSSCPEGNYYTIERGDTFFVLARRFDTTVEAIKQANPDVDPEALLIGMTLCIPESVALPPHRCPAGTTLYTIKRGDTFFHLAQRHNITVDALLRANPGIDPDRLRIGQVICIPEDNEHPVCPEGTYEYTIERADTLFDLAQYYNITVDAILRANPGIDPDRLRIGQVICIPRGTEARHEVECPAWTTPYEVRAGETLFRIANRNRLTLEDLLEANPHLTDPDLLDVGQIICLPDDE